MLSSLVLAASVLVSSALAAWPVSGTSQPDVLQDTFGPRILSGVYDFHRGIDLVAPAGAPIHSILPGKVVRIETAAQNAGTARARYGNWVLVEHAPKPDGTRVHSAYLHLSAIRVAVGQTVAEGGTVGLAGHSGDGIKTDHCHLTVYEGLTGTGVKNEAAVHPMGWIDYVQADDVWMDVDGVTASIAAGAPELDLVRFELVGTEDMAVIDFESGENLCGDAPACNGLSIAPTDFRSSDDSAAWVVTAPLLGDLIEVKVYDVTGEVLRWNAW